MLNFEDNNGKLVEKLIKERIEALNKFILSEKELKKMGVKFGVIEEDKQKFELYERYLPQFLNHFEEYEWEVIYKDGRILRQYDLDGQHHFGNIELENVKEVRYISNFYYETDNNEKRIIVKLDWENGKFDILNGFINQEDRNKIYNSTELNNKKLILFKRHRWGNTVEMGERIEGTGEIYFYKRYFLGYENENGKKILILNPNGEISFIKI